MQSVTKNEKSLKTDNKRKKWIKSLKSDKKESHNKK